MNLTEPRAKFLKVKCPDCPNEQIIFEKAAMVINCQVCGATVAEPSGGKAQIKGAVLGVME